MLRLKPDVEWQHVDDEIVALDLGSSVYVSLKDSGALLWPLIAAGTTESALVEELTARFDVDRERASVDVGLFVERLRSLALMAEEA